MPSNLPMCCLFKSDNVCSIAFLNLLCLSVCMILSLFVLADLLLLFLFVAVE